MISLLLFVALLSASAAELFCPLDGCSRPYKPPRSLGVCEHYDQVCCSSLTARSLSTWLNDNLRLFSNAECKALLTDMHCAQMCSPMQGAYVDVFKQDPLTAQFRICDTHCDVVYDACRRGTFDGEPVALRFPTPAALCSTMARDGVRIDSVPALIANAGRDAAHCYDGREQLGRSGTIVSGVGLGGGLTTTNNTFVLQAADDLGQLVHTGGDAVSVSIKGPNRFQPSLTDNGDGTYTVHFAPSIGGLYAIDARLGESQPRWLPVVVSVTAASLCPVQEHLSAKPAPPHPVCTQFNDNSCCYAADNSNVARLHTEYETTFAAAPACVEHFRRMSCGLFCSPEQSIWYDPMSNATGTPEFAVCDNFCTSWYEACASVQLRGGRVEELYASPDLFCEANTPSDRIAITVRDFLCFNDTEPELSCRDSFIIAGGDGIYDYTSGTVGTPVRINQQATFVIQAVDIYQNIKHQPGDTFQVTFNGPAGVVPRVRDRGDGTYLVSWNTTKAGTYMVSTRCNSVDEQIEHSPTPITVLPGQYNYSRLVCPPEQAFVGVPVEFTVRTFDAYDNALLEGGRTFSFMVEGPGSPRGSIVDNCDGTYSGTFTPLISDTYRLIVRDPQGAIVPNSPCIIRMQTAPPTTLQPTPMPTGKPLLCRNQTFLSNVQPLKLPPEVNTFTITTFDRDLQTPLLGGDAEFTFAFYLRMDGQPERNLTQYVDILSVVPGNDGTYQVSYVAYFIAPFWLQVNLTNAVEECNGEVAKIPVDAPPCDLDCRIGGICIINRQTLEPECLCFSPYDVCTEVYKEFPDLLAQIEFYCCLAPPFVTGIRFADDPSVSILVDWSVPIDQGPAYDPNTGALVRASMQGEFDCGILFDLPRMDAENVGGGLGTNTSFCTWATDQRLVVWLGANATVAVNDSIFINPNTVYSQGSSLFPASDIQNLRFIETAIVEPRPKPIILCPSTYNPCFNFRLEGSGVYGGGGRPSVWNWTLLSTDAPEASRIQALLDQIHGPTVAFTRDQSLLLRPGAVYEFAVIAVNHFEQVLSQTSVCTTRVELDRIAPQVTVDPPLVYAHHNDSVKVQAVVRVPRPQCDDGTPAHPLVPQAPVALAYRWYQVAGPGYPLQATTTNTASLFLPANTLVPDQNYTFQVEVTYADLPATSSGIRAVGTTKVVAQVLPIVALLDGGDRYFPYGAPQPLVLNASRSFDPNGVAGALRYNWTMLSGVGQRLDLPELATTGPVVTIPPERLSALGEQTYTVIVEVTNPLSAYAQARASRATATITAAAGNAPLVSIRGPGTCPDNFFDPTKRLVLEGVVSNVVALDRLELEWSTVEGYFPLNNEANWALLDVRDNTRLSLVVKPGVLSPQGRYTFRLTVRRTTDAGASQAVGYAEYRVCADTRPTAGYCLVVPERGAAATTRFEVKCEHYEDFPSQRPFTYRVWRRAAGATSDVDDFPLNVAPGGSNIMRFVLPPGTWDIRVDIADRLGVTTRTLIPGVQSTGAVSLAQAQRLLVAAEASGDEDAVLNAFDFLQTILNAQFAAQPGTKKKKRQGGGDETPAPTPPAPPTPDVSVDEVVEAVIQGIQYVPTRPAVETAALVLSRVVQLPISQASLATVAQFLDAYVRPTIRAAGVDTTVYTDRHAMTIGGALLKQGVYLPAEEAKRLAALDDQAAASGGGTTNTGNNANTTNAKVLLKWTEAASDAVRGLLGDLSRAIVVDMAPQEFPRVLRDSVSNMINVRHLKEWKREPTTTVNLLDSGARVRLPAAIFEEGRLGPTEHIGYGVWSVAADVYAYDAVVAKRDFALLGQARQVAVFLYDSENNALPQVRTAFGDAGQNLTINVVLDTDVVFRGELIESGELRGVCYHWAGDAFSERGCTPVEIQEAVQRAGSVNCSCNFANADFANTLGRPREPLPPGAPADDGQAPRIIERSEEFFDLWSWLLLLMVLFIWLAICFTGLLVLYARRRRKVEEFDTLKPYMDKAAGVGVLAALAADVGDVSDSSELERRDFYLPDGRAGQVYEIPDETLSEDLRADDFSWGLEGETATTSATSASEAGRFLVTPDEGADSEVGRIDPSPGRGGGAANDASPSVSELGAHVDEQSASASELGRDYDSKSYSQ